MLSSAWEAARSGIGAAASSLTRISSGAFSSTAEKNETKDTGVLLVHGKVKSIAIHAPKQRQYGPSVTLDPATLEVPNGHKVAGTATVAVVRQPFTADGAPPVKLSSILREIGPGQVAVAAGICRPAGRVTVNLYQRSPTGQLHLDVASVDVLHALHAAGVVVNVCPDPAAAQPLPSRALQSSNEVLMVSPTAFVFNEQAAQDNKFMRRGDASPTQRVLEEFAGLVSELRDRAGVKVHLFEHGIEHDTPDACFPNNWFSTHPAAELVGSQPGGTLCFYPMKVENRRRERRPDLVQYVRGLGRYANVVDMSKEEREGRYFEGTGSLVLDRPGRVAYVALSERSDAALAAKWADRMGYDLVTFHSTNRGSPVYHTNVMMAVGTGVAVVCLESVADPAERAALHASLSRRHEVVDITAAQMEALCGNVLEVRNRWNLPVMAMSTRSYNAFTPEQREAILRHVAAIHHAPIDTLEELGGGGVRCTLAELFP